MKSFEGIIDEIIANMDKQRENARIKAFVTDISMMLRENGVIPCMSEVSAEIDDNDALKTVFCCRLEKLDFTEHDKPFEKKIKLLQEENRKLYNQLMETEKDYQAEVERLQRIINHELGDWDKSGISYQEILDMKNENKALKQRISELERELEKKECIKTMRIEFHADNGEMLTPLEVANSLINQNAFKVDELRELAEHLQVYCRHHNDKEEDVISF